MLVGQTHRRPSSRWCSRISASPRKRAQRELKAQTANLERLDSLLAALTDTGDLRDLFDRISALAKQVIPHEAMALMVMLPDGVHAKRYASSGVAAGASGHRRRAGGVS